MKKAIWIVLALATANPAFAQGRDRNAEPAPPEKPELQASTPAPAPLPGALWSEVAARQLMGIDGNARQVGDLITIRVSERSFTSLDASTSTEKSSSSEAAISALFGAEKTLGDALPNAGANGIGMGASSAAEFDGSGSTARENRALAERLERSLGEGLVVLEPDADRTAAIRAHRAVIAPVPTRHGDIPARHMAEVLRGVF